MKRVASKDVTLFYGVVLEKFNGINLNKHNHTTVILKRELALPDSNTQGPVQE
ncbi:MAG TPA: hypothetical protein PLU53_08830 [Bacteroidia bacterium]|nr:hypothetical protein [Bacteroidia bacterium]